MVKSRNAWKFAKSATAWVKCALNDAIDIIQASMLHAALHPVSANPLQPDAGPPDAENHALFQPLFLSHACCGRA